MNQNESKVSKFALEELLNTILHGAGFILSIFGLILILFLKIESDYLSLFSFFIYGFSLVTLFLASSLMHGNLIKGTPNINLDKFDHCAIFVLIAGSYTPFALISLKGTLGYTFFAIVWFLAFLGIIYKLKYIHKHKKIWSNLPYLAMGWLCMFIISPIIDSITLQGFFWLFLGGLFYTLGVPFYVFDKKYKLNHPIWHLMVLGGSVSHYICILKYVIPNSIV